MNDPEGLCRVTVAVDAAVQLFRTKDRALVEHGASEWARAHRLAVYLEAQFPEWDVDCEYNRQGHGMAKKRMDDAVVRPDIVVHKRGLLAPEHNLLVIEVKRTPGDLNTTCERAREFTSMPKGERLFQYQIGLVICLDEEIRFCWYSGGEVIDRCNRAIERNGLNTTQAKGVSNGC